MAELRIERPTVVAVLASVQACDRLAIAGAALLRTAPREALVVGDADADTIRKSVDEPTALVDDVSDGWVAFAIVGHDTHEVWARLTELEPPDAGGWIQGEIAHAPAKAIATAEGLTLLIPAHLAAHVEERIRTDAAEVLT